MEKYEFIYDDHPLYEKHRIIRDILDDGFYAVHSKEAEDKKVHIASIIAESNMILFDDDFLMLDYEIQKNIKEHEVGHYAFKHDKTGQNRTFLQEMEADLYATIVTGKDSTFKAQNSVMEILKEKTENQIKLLGFDEEKTKKHTEIALSKMEKEMKKRSSFVENLDYERHNLNEFEQMDYIPNIHITVVNNYKKLPVMTCLTPNEMIAKPEFFTEFSHEERKLLYNFEYIKHDLEADLTETDALKEAEKIMKENISAERFELLTSALDKRNSLGYQFFEVEEKIAKVSDFTVYKTKDKRLKSHLPFVDTDKKIYVNDEFFQVFDKSEQRNAVLTREIAKFELGFEQNEPLSKEDIKDIMKKMFTEKITYNIPFGENDIYLTNHKEAAYLKAKEIKDLPFDASVKQNAELTRDLTKQSYLASQKQSYNTM